MNIYLQQLVNQSLSNKYTKWYVNVITTALSRSTLPNKDSAKHHILPRSFQLGGEKDKLNLVLLTNREHCICHKLLPRMLSGVNKSKMWYALWRIMNTKFGRTITTSREYSQMRETISKVHSNRIVSDVTRQRQSIAITGTHVGWHHTDAAKKRISDAHIGKSKGPFTAAHRAKLSLTHSGENHQNFGQHHSNETKQRISNTMKMATSKYHVIKVSCLQCRTVTNIGNYTKHHGHNCKH